MIRSVEKLLEQYRAHVRNLDNGDRLIDLGRGFYDLFCGEGWASQTRFKIVKIPVIGFVSQRLMHVSGNILSVEYRNKLLKELTSGTKV